MNHEYWDKLVTKIVLHYGNKIFLPISVRTVITSVKSVKYLWAGFKTLAHRKIEVPVLDATAIGVSTRATRVSRRTSSVLRGRPRVPSSPKVRKSSVPSAIRSSSTASPSKKGRKLRIPSSCRGRSSKKMPSSTRLSWANGAISIRALSSTMKMALSPYWAAKGN